jgi:hypothetical protein
MSSIQIYDIDRLLAKAREVHRPIRVSRYHIVTPDEHDVRRPGLLLEYSLKINETDDESTTWTFLEVVFADEKGNVDLGGTLLHRLQRQAGTAPVDFEVSRRIGAM